MKKITKIISVVLSSIALFSTAYAGELSVTGSASAAYNIQSGFSNAEKGIGIKNHLDFTGKGETDFGTFTYSMQQEPGTDGVMDIADQSLTLVSSIGTLGVFISEGGLDLEDGATRSVYSRPTDAGGNDGTVDNPDISSFNNVQFHTPAGLLPFGIVGKVAYAPDANGATVNLSTGVVTATALVNDTNDTGSTLTRTSTTIGSAVAYQITAAPMAGLSVGANYMTMEEQGVASARVTQDGESGAAFIKYDAGAFGLGISKALYAPFAATQVGQGVEYYDQMNYSVAFNVNENLSISYEIEKSEKVVAETAGAAQSANVEAESRGIQAAYTVGGLTLAVAHNSHDNVGYAAGKDAQNTVFAVTMAF